MGRPSTRVFRTCSSAALNAPPEGLFKCAIMATWRLGKTRKAVTRAPMPDLVRFKPPGQAHPGRREPLHEAGGELRAEQTLAVKPREGWVRLHALAGHQAPRVARHVPHAATQGAAGQRGGTHQLPVRQHLHFAGHGPVRRRVPRSARDCPQHYELANLLAQQAMRRGYTAAGWLCAATFDRWMLSLGRPQKYGTQFVTEVEGCVMKLAPYDPAVTDPVWCADAGRGAPAGGEAQCPLECQAITSAVAPMETERCNRG